MIRDTACLGLVDISRVAPLLVTVLCGLRLDNGRAGPEQWSTHWSQSDTSLAQTMGTGTIGHNNKYHKREINLCSKMASFDRMGFCFEECFDSGYPGQR